MMKQHKTVTGLMIILCMVSVFLCKSALVWAEGSSVEESSVEAECFTSQTETDTTLGAPGGKISVKVGSPKKQRLKKIKVSVTQKELKRFFGKSAFVGSSIGVGQRMYLDYEGRKYLGNPTMLVKGSYSFINDQIPGGQYRLTYHGKNCSARDAIALAKVKYVFINMGINDLWEGPEGVYKRYIKYVERIQKRNPGILIFIESTTPIFYEKQMQSLNNRNVNRLNKLMEKYCKKKKDVYFIDITSVLKDRRGGLAAAYCSDHFVHITMSGYRVWTKEVCRYIRQWKKKEKQARTAVNIAKKRKLKIEYDRAKNLVERLEPGSTKSELKKELKDIKYD